VYCIGAGAKGKHKRQVKRDESDMHWMGHRQYWLVWVTVTVCSSVRSWVMNYQCHEHWEFASLIGMQRSMKPGGNILFGGG